MSGATSRPRIALRDVDGILLLDKPLCVSSNHALQRARRLFRAAKAGHTGSLDPLATGVLPVCFGQATKVSGWLLDADKTYRARLALGTRTTTGDAEGSPVETAAVPPLDAAGVRASLATLVGEQRQLPPMYSALKRDGRPLYELARAGVEVEREPRAIVIRRLQLLALGPDWLEFEVECSKGTYVRTLGEDVARALGTCGHLAALRRTAVAAFAALPCHGFEELEMLAADPAALDAVLLPVDAALGEWPRVELDSTGADHVRHGRGVPLPGPQAAGAPVRLYGPDGRLLALATVAPGGRHAAPFRVLAAN